MILLFLLLINTTQSLSWYELYARGEKAYKSENYLACIEDMRSALSLNAETKRNVFTRGVQKLDYDPHFYLAMCLFKQGKIQEAYAESQIAFSGDVVSHTPVLQAELAKILDAYRVWIQEKHHQLELEESNIQLRKRISDLVTKGLLDEAEALIPSGEKGEDFSDLRSLIGQRRFYDNKLQRLVREFSDSISQLLQAGDAKAAQRLLEANRMRLPDAVIEDLSAQIRQTISQTASKPKTNELSNTLTNESNLEELQKRLQELVSSRDSLQTYVSEIETRNQELSESLKQRGKQVAPNMQLGLNLNTVARRKVALDGYILTVVPIREWSLSVDGKALPFSQKMLARAPNGYELKTTVLAPHYGKQEWQLNITDELGRNTSLKKPFEVPRPWWLYRSFWGLLLGLLLGFAGAGLLRNLFRKRRARLAHFNPYIAGSPIRASEMFFGRELLLQRIQGSVHKNSFMIHGDRRIGKTSLLCQLKKTLEHTKSERYGFYPAFIDLQGIQEVDLFHHILMELIHQASLWNIQLSDLDANTKHEGYTSRDFSRDIQRIIARLRDKDARHIIVVLLLDEVDVLNEFGEKTNQKLRSIFMKEYGEHLTCVMAGIHLKKEWESSGSPWYNFFEEIPIQPFNPQAARDLITQPVSGVFRYEADAIEHLITITSGLPYLIQKICVGLVNQKLGQNRFTITKADVESYLAGLEQDPMNGERT